MYRNPTTALSVPNLPGMLPDRQAWVYVSYFANTLTLLNNYVTQIAFYH